MDYPAHVFPVMPFSSLAVPNRSPSVASPAVDQTMGKTGDAREGVNFEIINTPDNKNRKRELFRISPVCHWCGVITQLHPHYDGIHCFGNTATVDHIKSKLECDTTAEHRAKSNTVLACHDCNNHRERQRAKREQSDPVMRAKSRAYSKPRFKRKY